MIHMQGTAAEAALVAAMAKVSTMTKAEKLKRKGEISARIKELKMTVLDLMEELEAIGDTTSLFSIDDVTIENGVATGTVTVDLNLILDWYQGIPGPNTGVLSLVAQEALADVMSRYDFGNGAKPGDEIVVVDVREGDLVMAGEVVENNSEECLMVVRDLHGQERSFNADDFAFRYERLFS